MPTGVQFLGLETLFAPLVVGKIKRVKPFYLTEFTYMKSLVDEADIPNIKITMCSPVLYDFQYGEKWVHKENNAYGSRGKLTTVKGLFSLPTEPV
jgi:methionine synthase II (cobalamin-independent)